MVPKMQQSEPDLTVPTDVAAQGQPTPPGRPLAFRSLVVDVHCQPLVHLVSGFQTDWQRTPVTWPVRARCVLSLLEGGVRPMGRRVTAMTHQGPLEFWQEGEEYLSQGLSLHLAPGVARLALGLDISAAASLLAFTEVQRAAGLLPLHASVLTRGGRTVAVSGPSGAGKSTAALRLLRQGWHLVAEDWAWLNPENLEVVGWDRGLRLRPESLERFAPELLAGAPTDEHGKKVLRPARVTGVLTLNALYFLNPAPSGTRQGDVRSVWGMVGLPLTLAARQASQTGVNALMAKLPIVQTERNDLIDTLR